MAKENTTTVTMKLYADGRIEEGEWKMTLIEMQLFVGGSIESVRSTVKHRVLICDDEGFLKQKDRNAKATELCHPTVIAYGGVRGDCLLVKA